MTITREQMLDAVNNAAIILIQTNTTSLTDRAIKTRIERVIDDLKYAILELEEQK